MYTVRRPNKPLSSGVEMDSRTSGHRGQQKGDCI